MRNIAMHEPYGVFFGFFDHAQAIRLGDKESYSRNTVEQIRRRFRDQCRQLAPSDSCKDMYAPQFASAFGHWDDIALMLIDQPEAGAQLASGTPQIERYSLATPLRNPFLLSEDVDESLLTDPRRVMSDLADERVPSPLITVTHIKLSGFLSLALGTYGQATIARLIAKRISDLVETMRNIELRSSHSVLFSSRQYDFETLKFCLLDTFSSEDFILITQSNNYSVSAMAISALRKLNFNDLRSFCERSGEPLPSYLSDDPVFENPGPQIKPIDFFRVFGELAGGNQFGQKPSGDQVFQLLGDNHLISGSYTTLGSSIHIGKVQHKDSSLAGRVRAHGFADVNPGHEPEVSNQLEKNRSTVFQSRVSDECVDRWHFVLPGKHDYCLNMGPNPRREELDSVLTSEVFRFSEKLFGDRNTTQNQHRNGSKVSESGFQDVSTALAIPIPCVQKIRSADGDAYCRLKQLIDPGVGNRHVDTMVVLEKVAARLRVDFLLDSPTKFDEPLGRLELSPSAKASFMRVIADFTSTMQDPLLFDSATDTIDAYFAFLKFIEAANSHLESLPMYERFSRSVNFRRFSLDFINSLKQAHTVRVSNSTARHEEWQGVFGASTTSLVSASECVLKCSLAILRQKRFPSPEDFKNSRSDITGVVCAVPNQQATAAFARIQDLTLALIRIDSAQIFRPGLLNRILHEAGHLYFQRFVCVNKRTIKTLLVEHGIESGKISESVQDLVYLRAAEVFSDLLVFEITFSCATDRFIDYQLSMINSELFEQTTNEPETPRSLISSTIERVYRLFLTVTYCSTNSKQSMKDHGIAAHIEAFEEFVGRAHGNLSIARFFNKDDFCDAARELATHVFESSRVMTAILKKAIVDLRSSLKFDPYHEHGKQLNYDGFLESAVPSLEEGIPIPLFDVPQPWDEGRTVFNLINYYVQRVSENNQANSKPKQTTGDAVQQNLFVHNEVGQTTDYGLFTVVMKSLWHVSTRQRMRRFYDLMQAALDYENERAEQSD